MEQSANTLSARRKVQLFCVGLPKSGTHSIAAIFAARFRSAHEPEVENCMQVILDKSSDKMQQSQVLNWLRERDLVMQLHMESSHVMAFLVQEIACAFPESRFILTLKDPLSWLDSQINHHITKRRPLPGSVRMRFRDLKFASDLIHPAEEAVLREHNVYTIDGYLSYWAFHIDSVLRCVPSERLLMLLTRDIGTSIQRIASFADIPVSSLDESQAFRYSNPGKVNILAQIERPYLDLKIKQHCEGLMAKLFQLKLPP